MSLHGRWQYGTTINQCRAKEFALQTDMNHTRPEIVRNVTVKVHQSESMYGTYTVVLAGTRTQSGENHNYANIARRRNRRINQA